MKVACMLVLVAVVLSVVLESYTTEAWRPQGRFGKRRLDQDAPQLQANVNPLETLASGEKTSATKNIPTHQHPDGTGESGYPVDLDMPVFQHGNIICINKGAKGIFRCVRWVSETTSD